MERQRKVKSSSTIALADDKISRLPKELILKILSMLPTETTIKTSTLSRNWKNQWKKMETLKFDSKEHKTRFSENVLSALLSYKNPALQSLTIGVSKICKTTDLAKWIAMAVDKKVPKLVLRLNEVKTTVPFPDGMLQHTNRLKILKLMGNMCLKLSPNSVALHCLKELHMYNVKFENEESVSNLLKGCPDLEDLILDIFIRSGVHTIRINIRTLKKLVFRSFFCEEERLAIQTPNLTYLDLQRFEGIKSCGVENLPNLATAKILNARSNMQEHILASIATVQHLTLCSSVKFPVNKTFSRLITLELDTRTDIWCNLLTFMLSVSPNLENLKLIGGAYGRWVGKWVQPQCVASSLQNKLHTLYWKEFIYDGDDDKDVARYILKNAAHLVKATFTTLNPPTTTLSQQRKETLYKLSSMARASRECHIDFGEANTCTENPSHAIDPDAADFHY